MHKKRLRKKLGKRYMAEYAKLSRAVAMAKTMAILTQTQQRIAATRLNKLMQVCEAIKHTKAMGDVWKDRKGKLDLGYDFFYRRKLGVLAVEQVHKKVIK